MPNITIQGSNNAITIHLRIEKFLAAVQLFANAAGKQNKAVSAAVTAERKQQKFLVGAILDLQQRWRQATEGLQRIAQNNAKRAQERQASPAPGAGEAKAREMIENRRAALVKEHVFAVIDEDEERAAATGQQLLNLQRLGAWQEKYAKWLQRIIDLEKQRQRLEKNSLAAARTAADSRIEALKAKNAASAADLLRRRPGADLETIERRSERILADPGQRGNFFSRRIAQARTNKAAEEAFKAVLAGLFQQLQTLENKARDFRDRAQEAEDAGQPLAAVHLQGLAQTEQSHADQLRSVLSDPDKVREQYGDQIDEETAQKRLEAYYARREARAKVLRELTQETAKTLTDGLAKAVTEGGKLKDHFKNIGKQLLKLALQKLVIDRATSLLSSALGGLFKLKPPGKAEGGPVEAGRLYMVGERGPELFLPRSAGEIIAHGSPRLAAAGNVTVNIDIGGIHSTDGPGVKKALAETLPVIESRVARAVKGDVQADLARPSALRGLVRG